MRVESFSEGSKYGFRSIPERKVIIDPLYYFYLQYDKSKPVKNIVVQKGRKWGVIDLRKTSLFQ